MPLLIQRASAGSGKTEQLARRYLQILLSKDAAGHAIDPRTILAATFTREAAGEILARILKILSLAAQDTTSSKRIFEGLNISPPSRLECQLLLRQLMEHIHRLRIGTIDALFAEQARSFALDLGLAPHWEIADSFTTSQLAQRTVLELMKVSPLFFDDWKMLHRFKRRLSFLNVAAQLFEKNRWLAHVQLLEPAPEDKRPPLLLTSKEINEIKEFLRLFSIPLTAHGKPNGHWVKALEKLQQFLSQALYLRDFLELSPLFLKLLEDEPRFYGQPIAEDFLTFFTPIVHASYAEEYRLSLLQESALHRLVEAYHELRSHVSFAFGRYSFLEIEEIVTRGSQQFSKEEMAFRMDLSTEHLLLDEYQDTSAGQHAFLFPLMGDVLAKGGCAYVVGDVKQGIYGWRGGRRHLLAFLEKAYEPYLQVTAPLHRSYRSSPAILAAVNHVFGALKNQDILERMKAGEAFKNAASRWSHEFHAQESAHVAASLRGEVRMHKVPVAQGALQETIMKEITQKVVQLVEHHLRQDPLRGVTILLRRRKFIPSLLMRLREQGIRASGEGGNPLADTLAIEVVLSLLSWMDHPGNSAAYEHVRISPLGELLRESGECAATQRAFLYERIIDHGYAKSIRSWVSQPRFQDACSDYEKEHLEKFIAMAYRFDALGQGSPSELVRRARQERVESRHHHGVRVLSMHASKGLEFETVILMDLETSIFGGDQRGIQIQKTDDGKFLIPESRRISECPRHPHREYLQNILREEQWEEALSLLYVAMTRAISYLDIVIADQGEETTATKSMASWLRASALENYFCEGLAQEREKHVSTDLSPCKESPCFEPQLLTRVPILHKRSPSKEMTSTFIELSEKFYDVRARAHGTQKHRRLSQIEWSNDISGHFVMEYGGTQELQAVFHREYFLSKWKEYGVTKLEVWRERPFALVLDEELVVGTFDRVVIGYADRPVRAQIIDFKSGLARIFHTDLLRRPGKQMDAALDSHCDLSGMYTYSPASKCSSALPHLPSQSPRHDQYEISGLGDLTQPRDTTLDHTLCDDSWKFLRPDPYEIREREKQEQRIKQYEKQLEAYETALRYMLPTLQEIERTILWI